MRPRTTKLLPLVVLALALPLLAATPASAAKAKKKANRSIVEGTVSDQEQNPLAGVAVTMTLADRPDFREERTTDAKGRFEVEFAIEASAAAHFRFEKAGFEPYEVDLEVGPGVAHEATFRLVAQGANNPYKAVEAFKAAAAAYDRRDPATAEAKAAEAIGLDPTLAPAHLLLAEVRADAGRYAEAAPEVEAYLTAKPDDARGQALAFEVFHALGDEERAEGPLAAIRGTDVARGLATRIYNQGVAASREGDSERALAEFRTALELAPDLTALHAGTAALLYNLERFDEALAEVDQVLAAEPDHLVARRLRYQILTAQGDPAAADALRSYAELAPAEAAAVLYDHAEEDFRSGRIAAAKAGLLEVLNLQPDHPRAHYTLGLCYASGGELAKAREHLRRFLELAPDDSEAPSAREMLDGL